MFKIDSIYFITIRYQPDWKLVVQKQAIIGKIGRKRDESKNILLFKRISELISG